MTRKLRNRYLNVLFCVACASSSLQHPSMAAESTPTNQTSSVEIESRLSGLTTAEQVHRLTRAEAAVGQHVLIRGVVTCALPAYDAAVVQDATSGIYIDWRNSSLGPPARVDNCFWILISDKGGGFDTVDRSNGYGLLNLRSRLEQLRGRCELESSPSAGTTVSLQMPLPSQ